MKSGGTVIFDNRPGYIYPGNFYFYAKEEMLCEDRSVKDVDGVFLGKKKTIVYKMRQKPQIK